MRFFRRYETTRYLLVIGRVRRHLTQTKMSIRFFVGDIVAQTKTITAFYEPTDPGLGLYSKRQICVSGRPRSYYKWKSWCTRGTTQLLIDRGTWRSRIQLCDHRYTWWNCNVDSVHPGTMKNQMNNNINNACRTTWSARRTYPHNDKYCSNYIIMVACLRFRIWSRRNYRFPDNGAQYRYIWLPRAYSRRHRTATRTDIDSVGFHDRLDKLMCSCLRHSNWLRYRQCPAQNWSLRHTNCLLMGFRKKAGILFCFFCSFRFLCSVDQIAIMNFTIIFGRITFPYFTTRWLQMIFSCFSDILESCLECAAQNVRLFPIAFCACQVRETIATDWVKA